MARDIERDNEMRQRNGGVKSPETGKYDGSFPSGVGYGPGEADLSDDESTFNMEA